MYMYSSDSAGPQSARDLKRAQFDALRALNSDRERRRVASTRVVAAETHVSHALSNFASAGVKRRDTRAGVKSHVMREMPARTVRAERRPAESTRNVAPARTRVDDSPVLFIESRAANDDAMRAEYDAAHLESVRAERARAMLAGESRRPAERDARTITHRESDDTCAVCHVQKSLAGTCECDDM